jgi:hypothetical protein
MPRLLSLIAFWVAVAAVPPAMAQEERVAMPDKLSFGYEDEGLVDASPAACDRDVRQIVEWAEPETLKAAKDICAARRKHLDAYAAIQQSYKTLAKLIADDHRLDPAETIRHFEQMVKECVDHKTGMTPGGHNIMIDIIPNEIAARCLDLGRSMLDDEASWLKTDPEKHVNASP